MKKILSLVLSVLMIFSVLPAVFAAGTATTTAVEETSPYQDAIDFLGLKGIELYKGTASGAAANEKVSRWQMALFVSRLVTGHTDDAYWATQENDSGFTDVAKFDGWSEAALGAISFASQKAIINGYGDGKFGPSDGITYRDAITMIVRALGYTYKASGYPWSYITKADDLGILAGITGVGYTDEISRGVVAQLLYNAFFADVDGKTIASTVFGVGQTVVLITATNAVVYEGGADKVLRTDYVQFAELDAQGEPTGAKYHVAYDKFGLADDNAANAAVGTSYFIYYKDGCADILYSESLSKTFTNFGKTKAEITTASSNAYISFGGNKYKVVSKYNDLNNSQGWNADAAGTDEIKLYNDYGAVLTANTNYIVAWNGDIYHVSDPIKPVAIYSSITGKYYKVTYNADGTKNYTIVNADDYLQSASQSTTGFKKLTAASVVSAYTKIVASDSNMDGYYDRATLRNYQIGLLSISTNLTRYKSGTSGATETGKNYLTLTYDANYNNQMDTSTLPAPVKTGSYYNRSQPGWVDDITFTGLQYSELKHDYLVIYYYNPVTAELDVVAQIAPTRGYVRGFDITKNTITIDDKAISYGYNTLTYSPLMTKDQGGTNANLANNLACIQNFLNTYVKYYVVDDVVVYVNNTGVTADYVILDSFVSFDDDGITANAWTTVTNSYEQIKISEFNGWTIGGLDYYLYYLSGLIGGNANLGSQYIPVSLGELYRVVYQSNGVYNLTQKSSSVSSGNYQDVDFSVNQYGYILGMNNSSAVGSTKYVATDASDFWLILDTVNKKVYTYTGKMGVIDVYGVDVYKCANHDYVMIADENTDGLDNITAMLENNVKYMVYNYAVNLYGNDYLYDASTSYGYGHYFTDILTGSVSYVSYDSKVSLGDEWFVSSLVPSKLTEGAIYRVSDGVLKSLDTYELFDAVNFYDKSAAYDLINVYQVYTGATATAIRNLAATDLITYKYPDGSMTGTGIFGSGAVTLYSYKLGAFLAKNADPTIAAGKYCYAYVLASTTTGAAIVYLDLANPMDILDEGDLTQTLAVTGDGVAYGNTDGAAVLAGFDIAVAYSYNEATDTLTLSATVPAGFALDADDAIIGWVGGADVNATKVVNGAVLTVDGADHPTVASFELVFTSVTELPTELHLQFNRANFDECYYEFSFAAPVFE